MLIVDTKGQQCPAPLIATKKALKESKTGETFQVLIDSKTSFDNISRFLRDNKSEFSGAEAEGIWTITVTKRKSNGPVKNAAEFCEGTVPHFSQGDFVIALTSDKMGEGDEELGRLLIMNFIKAIKELNILPGKMVFYNNGVKLGVTGSPVHKLLEEIESMGVRLLFCATCVRHYSLEDKIKIGILSNMFEITQVMSSASNVIKP